MPANTSPIFPLTPNVGEMNVVLSTAMTNTKAYDGTEAVGTAMALVLTAGANGARVDSLTCAFTSTNGATVSGTTAASVIRFWINNNSVNTTATNNQLLGEVRMPATAMTALATGINNTYTLDVNRSIPAGYRIYAGITVAIGGTNAAVTVTANAGDY
jgi:hypothetical protein